MNVLSVRTSGATLASETTAAAEGTLGEVRRDPFAMVPFCGYNMGDYMQNWLDMGDRLRGVGRMPRIFHVNWFQKDDDGRFIWPGFGENSRVVEWIVNRLEGAVAAEPSPIGLLPKSLNTEGLDLSEEALSALLSVSPELVSADLDDAEKFLAQFGDRLPQEILGELHATRERLAS
jgi:phosphoenolpyruvate carboxykinase (GTP)